MSLESFFQDEDKVTAWGNFTERQIRLRIKLSVAAYAYEMENDEIMPDSEFDMKCLEVVKGAKTGNKKLDDFFRNNFDPSTGQWINKHPELGKIKAIYHKYYK